jgi:hypothetical protein
MMRPRFYKLLEESIEAGARRGYRRAYKHNENPTDEELIEAVTNCIMGELHENFTFTNEDNE